MTMVVDLIGDLVEEPVKNLIEAPGVGPLAYEFQDGTNYNLQDGTDLDFN